MVITMVWNCQNKMIANNSSTLLIILSSTEIPICPQFITVCPQLNITITGMAILRISVVR